MQGRSLQTLHPQRISNLITPAPETPLRQPVHREVLRNTIASDKESLLIPASLSFDAGMPELTVLSITTISHHPKTALLTSAIDMDRAQAHSQNLPTSQNP